MGMDTKTLRINSRYTKTSVTVLALVVLTGVFSVPVSAAGDNAESISQSSSDISGDIKVQLNYGDDDIAPYISEFEEKYPDVKVTYEYLSDYDNDMKKELENGNYGDVVFVPGYLGSDEFAGYFQPLGSLDAMQQKYLYVDQGKIADNKVYGLPSTAYVMGIIYNSEVFDKAGITKLPTDADSFLEALQQIKDRTDAIPFYTNYADSWPLQYWETFPYIEMTGDPAYKTHDFVYEENPFAEGTGHNKVYKLLYDIVSQGLCEDDPSNTNWNDSKQMINSGDIGCMALGSWAMDQCKKAGTDDNLKFMPFPNNIKGKQYATIQGDYSYAVNKNSKNIDAAKAFVSFMIDESGYALDHDDLSIVKTDPYPEFFQNMSKVTLLENNGYTSDDYQNYEKLSAGLNISDTDNIKRVIDSADGNSSESFDQIMDEFDSKWEKGRTDSMRKSGNTGKNVIDQVYEFKNDKVTFSNTEMKYLDEEPELTVGYIADRQPYQYSKDGDFSGLCEDVMSQIGDTSGLSFTYKEYTDYDKMIEALENGDIAMAAGIYGSDETSSVKHSKEYFTYNNMLVSNQSFSLDKMKSKKAVLLRDEKNKFSDLSVKAYYEDSLHECMKQVSQYDADYTIGDYYGVSYYISKFDNLKMTPLTDSESLCIGFGPKTDSRMISICNKVIYSIPQEKIQTMVIGNMGLTSGRITLWQYIESNPIKTIIMMLVICAAIVTGVIMINRAKLKISEQRAIDARKYELLASMSNEYIFDYDYIKNRINLDKKLQKKLNSGSVIDVSDKYQKLSKEETDLIDYIELIKHDDTDVMQVEKAWNQDGTSHWYRIAATIVRDSKGNPQSIICKVADAQQEMERQIELQEKAEKDPLTGIYNRNGLMEAYDAIILEGEDNPYCVGVIDVDNFKGVNDELGHLGGDRALISVAEKIRDAVGNNGIYARIGGDEFLVVLPHMTLNKSENTLKQICSENSADVSFEGKKKHITVSIGAAYSDTKQKFDDIFDQADKQLYIVKQNGRNNYKMEVCASNTVDNNESVH